MAEPSKGNGSQPGDAGLNDLFAGEPDPVERDKALESYSFFVQGQPSGFSAHLARLFKALARTLIAAVIRIEKAAEVTKQSASLQAKLTDAQVQAISKALGVDVERAAARFRYTEYVVNWGLVAVIGALCAILGAGILGWFWYQAHQEYLKTPEYNIANALHIIGGDLKYDCPNGHTVIITVLNPAQLHPGNTTWATYPPVVDGQGNVSVKLVNLNP